MATTATPEEDVSAGSSSSDDDDDDGGDDEVAAVVVVVVPLSVPGVTAARPAERAAICQQPRQGHLPGRAARQLSHGQRPAAAATRRA